MRSQINRHLAGIFATDIPHPSLARLQLTRAGAKEHLHTGLPREFSWHDYAVYLLHIAAEIEHSLMVQYLYAAYSLGGPCVPQEKCAEVLKWQNLILGVAKEEMGHFLTVQNILRLIGGGLNLDRQDFPWDIPFYPYDFALEPLTRTSLAKYIFAEAPKDWPPDLTTEERTEIEAAVHKSPRDMPHRVGELYELMIDILSNPDAVPDSAFRESTVPFQASWDEWGRGYNGTQRGSPPTSGPANLAPNVIVARLASRTDAVAALNLIARQGEWPESDPRAQELSHFRRFLDVFRAFPKPEDGWSAAGQIPTNPQAPGFGNSDAGPTIENPEAALWSTLFNIRYRMLLTYLAHSFRLSAETGADSPRSMVINRTFVEMYNLRSTAGILVQLPLKSDAEPERAGPPFQVPYTVQLPSDEADCWRLHADLIDAAAVLLARLAEVSKDRRADYAVALLNADRQARLQLEPLMRSSGAGQDAQPRRRSIAI
jgi:hypothetical protein